VGIRDSSKRIELKFAFICLTHCRSYVMPDLFCLPPSFNSATCAAGRANEVSAGPDFAARHVP